MVKGVVSVMLAMSVALPLEAQLVGTRPDRSPFRDLEHTRELTGFAGYYSAEKDPEGVAPRSGPMLGGRWDLRIGGPAYLAGRVGGAMLPRNIVDPSKPIDERFVGEETVPMLFTDVVLGIHLTGFKAWHGIVPLVNGGFGITADLRGKNDVGDYRFGAPMTFTYGAAIKWLPLRNWQVRLDWVTYIYRIHYPESYYLRTGTDDPVRLPNEPNSLWQKNRSLQLGVAHFVGR